MSKFWDSLKDGLSIIFNLSIIIGVVVMLIIVALFYQKEAIRDLPNGKIQCSVMAELSSKPDVKDGMLCLTERMSWEYQTFGGEGKSVESRFVFPTNLNSQMIKKMWDKDGKFTLIYRVVNTGSITRIPHIEIVWVE